MNDPTTIDITVTNIAQALNERNTFLLQKVVAHIGTDRALAFLAQTQQIEAGAGLRTEDNKRRRTPGGVFFYLVKHSLPSEERQQLWPPVPKKKKKPKVKSQESGVGSQQSPPPPTPKLTWEDAKPVIIAAFKSETGDAKTVKLTLIGRPANIQPQATYVAFSLKGKDVPALPSGLPPVVNLKPPVYAVLVAIKQWRKVEQSLKENLDDQVIIEGWPTVDPQKGVSIVWASSCKSVAMERAGREKKDG